MLFDVSPAFYTFWMSSHLFRPSFGTYRRRLIKDGIIEAAGHGFVHFTIPYTAEHLREHAAHDALEGMGQSTSKE